MKEKEKRTRKKTSYTGLGIAFGASFGFIIGLLLFEENIAVGIGIGVAFGLIIGAIMDTRKGEDEEK